MRMPVFAVPATPQNSTTLRITTDSKVLSWEDDSPQNLFWAERFGEKHRTTVVKSPLFTQYPGFVITPYDGLVMAFALKALDAIHAGFAAVA